MKPYHVMVALAVEPVPGSQMGAAFHNGCGEEFVRSYLASKMPAGSPVTVLRVAEIPAPSQDQEV